MPTRTVTLYEAKSIARSWKMSETDEDVEALRCSLQKQYDAAFRSARQRAIANLRINREWRREYWAKLVSMSNDELIDELIEIAGGDDYDGGFTADGQANLWFARRLLKNRLSKAR